MRSVAQDLQFGARAVLKNPGFAFVVSATLALAIGANSVIFSFASSIFFRPLPIADGVAFLEGLDPQTGDGRARFSAPDFLDFRERNTTFLDLAAFYFAPATLTGSGDPLRVTTACATASQFPLWGLKTVLGRAFTEAEDAPGAAGVVVVSHGFWTRHLGADPGVVGRVLTLDDRPHEVVGVLGPEIEIGGLSRIEMWTPLAIDRRTADRAERVLRTSGRLKPGATVAQASAEIASLAKRLQTEHPTTNTGWEARVLSSRDSLMGPNAFLVLTLLTIVVSGVLLVGCANVANLMLARGVTRQRELAVRTALGASRLRIVRQLLTEGLILSLLGALGGLLVAGLGLRLVRAIAYEPAFRLVEVDYKLLLFAGALALLTPLVFGLLPALQATAGDTAETLKQTGGRGSGGPRGRRSRSLLVVSQLALASALLIAAGFVLRSAYAASHLEWGFEPEGLVALRLELPSSRYPTDDDVRSFENRILGQIRALPGVRSAAAETTLPVVEDEKTVTLELEGREAQTARDQPWAVAVTASPSYRETLGLPLLAGRDLTAGDGPNSSRVALVSQEMARRYWGEGNAVGERFRLRDEGGKSGWIEVVGVVGDVRPLDPRTGKRSALVLPLAQYPARAIALLLRVDTDPAGVVPALRAEMRAADPGLALYDVTTLAQLAWENQSSDVVVMGLFVSFAIVALLMAAAGLYAVMSYSVTARRQEIGIRLALGARAPQIRAMVVSQGARLALASLVLGVTGGLGLGVLMSGLLFGVTPTDPVTYGTVVLLLVGVALAGSYVPAWRASRVDPALTLRAE
jgi:putative ABC transport system permease protein